MKYNINVIKFVWRQLRKLSRVTLDAATLRVPLSLWNIGTNSGACDYVAKFTKDASNADRRNWLTMPQAVVRSRNMNVSSATIEISPETSSQGDRFRGRSNHQQHPSWMAVGIVRPRQQSNQQLERSYKITK